MPNKIEQLESRIQALNEFLAKFHFDLLGKVQELEYRIIELEKVSHTKTMAEAVSNHTKVMFNREGE